MACEVKKIKSRIKNPGWLREKPLSMSIESSPNSPKRLSTGCLCRRQHVLLSNAAAVQARPHGRSTLRWSLVLFSLILLAVIDYLPVKGKNTIWVGFLSNSLMLWVSAQYF